jgi:tRNA pseudouridine38-40 synthase
MPFRALFVILCLKQLLPLDSWALNRPSSPKARQCSGKVHGANSKNIYHDCATENDAVKITSMLLQVSYDGGRFTGWSAANSDESQSGFVRSIQGILSQKIARLFGDVDPARVVVEGTSRTDKGVHAKKMVAQVYCLSEKWESDPVLSIPGKRLPHPMNSTDDKSFVPFPMDPAKLMFVLNRMMPDDISIRGISRSPCQHGRPFHPTLDSVSKTYQYTFSIGNLHDPTQWRRTWHIGPSCDVVEIAATCKLLEGTHDFCAFRGAPRGKEDRRRQETENTVCTLTSVAIHQVNELSPIPDLRTFRITVTGGRFLYKMVRFLVGAVIEVGQGKLALYDVQQAMETGSFVPNKKPQCAPAHGLTLMDVEFAQEIDWIR